MRETIRTLSLSAALLVSAPLAAEPVDINSADAATLAAALRGIGEAKALAIVDYRDRHGPFSSADDLARVKGIGERTVEINRGDIRLSPSAGR